MKTITKLLTALALLGLGLIARASEYDTFLQRDAHRTGTQAVQALLNATGQERRKADLFFSAAGVKPGELRAALAGGLLTDAPCGDCNLRTAGIKDGVAEYHRRVESGEVVTYLTRDGARIPLLLPACGNPVRTIPLSSPIAQQQIPLSAPPCVDRTIYEPGSYVTPGGGFGSYWYGPTVFTWVASHEEVACPIQIMVR